MTTSRPSGQGPYLSAAFCCEKVLVGQDGVKSAIRIIDRVTRTVMAPAPPSEMEPFDHEFTIFVRFKSGRARGSQTLEIQPIKPSAETLPPVTQSVLFEGEEDRGVDSIGQIRMTFDQTGIYWFVVRLDNTEITRIPFRVIYRPEIRQLMPGSDVPPQA